MMKSQTTIVTLIQPITLITGEQLPPGSRWEAYWDAELRNFVTKLDDGTEIDLYEGEIRLDS